MDRPSECKWCGAKQISSSRSDRILFSCWTYYEIDDGCWRRDAGCVDQMAAQAEILRERIRHALERLKSAKRYDTDEVDPDTWCGDDVAQAVDADCVDEVIRILEGVDDDETK